MSKANHSRNLRNRPGLPALSYRVGDYGSFRRALLDRLSEFLPNLKTRDPDDPAIALLDAWAVVADVLTFYQERIANEGYLNTATERQSIIELGRLIGYELQPGVSASTHLAFTLEEKPGEPLQVVLPQGTQAMSIPAEGEKPQTFETSKDLLVSPRWNALTPRLGKPQEVRHSTHSLYVQGTSLKVDAGDWVLLTGTQDQAETTFLLKLATVEPKQDLGATLISWDYDLEQLAPKDFLRNPQLFAFRLRAGLFGNNAPRWEAIPDDLKQKSPGVKLKGGVFKTLKATDSKVEEIKWEANSEGLPSQDILCLAARKSYFFAGTEDKGIFRLEQPATGDQITKPAQLAWQPINNGLTCLNIQTIYVMDEERGYLLAGTPLGGVFRSKDNGETWSPIGTGNTRLQKDANQIVNAINTGIPNVVVRSLLAYSIGQTTCIFAGTDDDIYRTTNQGQDWSSTRIPISIAGDNYHHLDGLPERVIYSLLHTPGMQTSITGKLSDLDKTTKKVTVGNATGILQKDDFFLVEDHAFLVKEDVRSGKLKMSNVFPPEASGKHFKSSSGADGIIFKIFGKILTIHTLKGRIQVGEKLTVRVTISGKEEEYTHTIEQVICYKFTLTDDETEEETNKIKVDSTFQAGSMKLLAGTDQGVYISLNHGENWNLMEGDLADTSIFTLTPYTIQAQSRDHHYILAGTSTGVWQYNLHEDSPSWKKADKNNTLSERSVHSIKIEMQGTNYGFAATDDGVFQGEFSDAWAWKKTEESNPMIKGITSIVVSSETPGLVLAGARFTGFTEEKTVATGNETRPLPVQTEWPDFYIQNNRIDLDAQHPKILKDSWVGLVDQSQEAQLKSQDLPPHLPIRVEQVSTEQRKAFTLDSKITRIIPDLIDRTPHQPGAFDPRSTLVLAQSEALPLADVSLRVEVQQSNVFQDPLWDNKIFLSQYVHGLEPSKAVIISGQYIRAKVNAGGIFRPRDWQFLSPDLRTKNIHSLALREIDGVLYAASETDVWESNDNGQHWEALSRQGLVNTGAFISSIAIYSRDSSRIVRNSSAYSSEEKILWSLKQDENLFGSLKTGDTITFDRQTRTVIGKNLIKSTQKGELLLNLAFSVGFLPSQRSFYENKVFVGTDQGVFRYKKDESSWEKVAIANHHKLSNIQVLLVAILEGHHRTSNANNNEDHYFLVAGTQNQGVFISKDDGISWKSKPLPQDANVLALAADPVTGNLFAGTEEHGVFYLLFNEDEKQYTGKWQPINQDLPDLHILSLVVQSNEPGNNILFAGTETSGVFHRSVHNIQEEPDKPWQPLPQSNDGIGKTNLAGQKILTLYLEAPKYLMAGTDEGVYRLDLSLQENKQVWESVSVGLNGLPIQSLVNIAELGITTQKRLLAATPSGIFQLQHPEENDAELYWHHSNRGLTYSNVTALVNYRLQGQLRLFAGTHSGIFRSLNQGQTWELMIQGLNNTEVQALLSIQETDGASDRQEPVRVLAGTKEGLFESLDEGRTWQRVKLGIPRPSVQALAVHPSNQSYLFAGTLSTGLFRSSDQGKTWVGLGLTKQDIRVLSFIKQKHGTDYLLMVGTAGGGIWVYDNNGDSWENWTNTRSGTGKLSSDRVTVTSKEAQFNSQLQTGDRIEVEGQVRTVVNITSEKELTVDIPFDPAIQEKSFIIHTGLENLYITAFAYDHDQLHLYVGTAGSGIFRTVLPKDQPISAQNQRWVPVNSGIKNLEIRCLTASLSSQESYLYAGTASGGVFRFPLSPDSDAPTWRAINTGLTNTDVRAILIEDNHL
jgi:photosystem II stability/assembly factor-like uncharacterized protein